MSVEANILSSLADLTKRVTALEKTRIVKESISKPDEVLSESAKFASVATDSFAATIKVKALALGLRQMRMVRCADEYYTWPLDQRRRYLKAPSTDHLCKSIVMCNTYCTRDDCEDPLNSKYYCVIVQYHTKLSASDLMRIVKKLQADAGRKPQPNKQLHFRLAEDCLAVTGYPPNGVTPVGLKTHMPIVLDRTITKLEPSCFWMGGGEVSLKLRVDVDEFCKAFKPILGDVTPE